MESGKDNKPNVKSIKNHMMDAKKEIGKFFYGFGLYAKNNIGSVKFWIPIICFIFSIFFLIKIIFP